MTLLKTRCSDCGCESVEPQRSYPVKDGENRTIFFCPHCELSFSETKNTALANLKTPVSLIVTVLNALAEGMGVNAVTRVFGVSKNSVYRWQERLSETKETLLLYALCHEFLKQVIEGDELYTKVAKNVPQDESTGWTVVLMERATRFIWELECGRKDCKLFKRAMDTLCRVIKQTGDTTLITDGERRYGNLLFDACSEVLRTGKRGRPKRTLPKGVKVRVKNKGSQAHKRGPKRPKYQAPQNEHPETEQTIADQDIHANHVEAFNAALRRRRAAFRRRTNTYAKENYRLQERLNIEWLLNNFVRPHFTTKQVPAVAMGILGQGLSFEDLFAIQNTG